MLGINRDFVLYSTGYLYGYEKECVEDSCVDDLWVDYLCVDD